MEVIVLLYGIEHRLSKVFRELKLHFRVLVTSGYFLDHGRVT